MKKLLVLILGAAFFLAGCAGFEIAKNADQPIVYVIDAPNKTKDQLFSASKSWIAETFVSGKAVMDDADKDSGRIVAKARLKRKCEQGLDCLANGVKFFGFTVRIDTKDGKLRMTYLNPTVIHPATSGSLVGTYYSPGSPEGESRIVMQGDLDDATKAFTALSEGLKNYINNESVSNKNW